MLQLSYSGVLCRVKLRSNASRARRVEPSLHNLAAASGGYPYLVPSLRADADRTRTIKCSGWKCFGKVIADLLGSPHDHNQRAMLRNLSKRSYLPLFQQMSTSATSGTPTTQRPSKWKAAAPAAPPATLTYSSILPKLPVLYLQETLTRLKQSLKPIAWSDLEYASVERKIDEFGARQGPDLQDRLLRRADGTPHWLEEWWDDAGYLGYRDSVSFLSNLHVWCAEICLGCNKRVLLLYVG